MLAFGDRNSVTEQKTSTTYVRMKWALGKGDFDIGLVRVWGSKFRNKQYSVICYIISVGNMVKSTGLLVDEAYEKNIRAAERELRQVCLREKAAPLFLRLAFHDAMTHDKASISYIRIGTSINVLLAYVMAEISDFFPIGN